MSSDKRKGFIRLLIAKYNPTRADIFMRMVWTMGLCLDTLQKSTGRTNGSHKARSQESSAYLKRTSGVRKVYEDIRDWERMKKLRTADIDWVTGIDYANLMEYGGQHCYNGPDRYPTSTRLNDAREASPAFHTRASLAAVAAKHEMSELQVIIKRQREMVEALIGHWVVVFNETCWGGYINSPKQIYAAYKFPNRVQLPPLDLDENGSLLPVDVNMLPFQMTNPANGLQSFGIPNKLQRYAPLIAQCLIHSPNEWGKIGYLTVHESWVDAGKSQRRPILHIESPGTVVRKDGRIVQENSFHEGFAWGGGANVRKVVGLLDDAENFH
ncbi:UNVERIFIED_CONTAM: hypothetical protein HDU68_010928, partial [Siphonaria sp. JEL0065]